MAKGLKVLQQEWHDCRRCKLGEQRPRPEIVFGLGNPRARYVMLYDAPTHDDAEIGLPMSGTEGELLSQLLDAAKIDHEHVYCTAVVGCRPTVLLPATADRPAQVADREPDKDERAACTPRVREILYRVDPLVIFTMGDLAWKTMVKKKDRRTFTKLADAVGELFVTEIPGRLRPLVTYDVIPLMSMKQIIASPSKAKHGPAATTARHLHKGHTYADFLAKTGSRDAARAGFVHEGASV